MDEKNALFAPKPEWRTELPPITPNSMLQMLTRTPSLQPQVQIPQSKALVCTEGSDFKSIMKRY